MMIIVIMSSKSRVTYCYNAWNLNWHKEEENLLLASNEKLKQEMWEVKTCANKWKRFTNDVCSIL